MRVKLIGATSFLVLAVSAVNAQAPQSTAADKPSSLSAIAHNLTTWLGRVTGQRAEPHPAPSLPPLPRARPVEATPAPVVANERSSEVAPAPAPAPVPAPPTKKTAPARIQIND